MLKLLFLFVAMIAIGLLKYLGNDNTKTKKTRVSKPKPTQVKAEQKQLVKEQMTKLKEEELKNQSISHPPKIESKLVVTKPQNKTYSFVTLPSSYDSSEYFSNLNHSDAEFQKEIEVILESNGKFEAVNFAMRVKGWGLKQAKTYCDDLSVALPSKKEKITPLDPSLIMEIKEKMRVAGKLEAIKFLMAKTGLSLQESKKYCDPWDNELDFMANLSTSTPNNAFSTGPNLEIFDLEKQIQKLMDKTKWNYSTCKAYCEKALEYQKKIGTPARLKKK